MTVIKPLYPGLKTAYYSPNLFIFRPYVSGLAKEYFIAKLNLDKKYKKLYPNEMIHQLRYQILTCSLATERIKQGITISRRKPKWNRFDTNPTNVFGFLH